MNPIKSMIRVVGKGLRWVINYQGDWEGGARWSERRGRVGSYRWANRPPGPNEANDQWSRMEIVRKVQHFERNNSLVQKALYLIEHYSAGANGMPVIASSSSPEWNVIRQEKWDRWCQLPDLTSRVNFGQNQRLMARCCPRDGRILIYLTVSDTPVKMNGDKTAQYRPRIQLIESARLQTPSDMVTRNDIFDGIQVDSRGRALFYYFTETDSSDIFHSNVKFKKIPAEQIIDYNERIRPGELHPMSIFAPVLNDIQDLIELCAMAMDKAKDAAQRTNVYRTRDAVLPDEDQARKRRLGATTVDTVGGGEKSVDVVEQTLLRLGPGSVAIGIDEEVTQLQTGVPNEFDQAHWQIITQRICMGIGIPKILILPDGGKWQGTVVRGEYDMAATYFRSRSSDLAEVLRRIYEYVTEQELQFDPELTDGLPKDWRKCTVRFPRAVNVDVGHNSAAMIAEYLMGMRTLQSIYAEVGEDAREQIDTGIAEIAYIKSKAKEMGIEPAEFSQKIGDALKLQMDAEAKQQAEEDKDFVDA